MRANAHQYAAPSIAEHAGIGPVTAVYAGAIVAGWGWLTFPQARTTTVPGARSAQLVQRGPYRFTGNPMDVGLVFAYIGEAGILTQVWRLVLLRW